MRRLYHWSQWRCLEPVVVFESDDWGLERRPCSEFLRAYGEPSSWAEEQLETPEDLAGLYDVLDNHRDSAGRPACFTANFIVGNPDFDAISRDRFTHYYDIPIGQDERLKKKWLEGMERRVLYPQYHGRTHFWPEAWLRDLRDNVPGAREMFNERYHGGIALLKKHGWRYHSEYTDWKTGEQREEDELRDWLKVGTDYFLQLFGYFPRSTIASHFVLTPEFARAWHAIGGQFIQGTGYRIVRRSDGRMHVVTHALGERSPEGLLLTRRTAKFEPRLEESNYDVDSALREVEHCFRSNIPVIIDTHRINYTGRWRNDSLKSLDSFLRGLQKYKPRFLTSVEIGEAIDQNGHYRDVWTGEASRLTSLETPWRKMLRARWGHYVTSLMIRTNGKGNRALRQASRVNFLLLALSLICDPVCL
jgi:hypothetical protein